MQGTVDGQAAVDMHCMHLQLRQSMRGQHPRERGSESVAHLQREEGAQVAQRGGLQLAAAGKRLGGESSGWGRGLR